MRTYKNVLAEIWTVCVGLCSPWAKHILLESSSLKTGFAWRRQLARGLLLGLGRGACAVGPGGLIWRHLSPGWAPGSLLASSSFLLYWFEVNRKHSQASIVIIRSECLPWICTVEITPRWGHNKSGPFFGVEPFFFLCLDSCRHPELETNWELSELCDLYVFVKEPVKSIQKPLFTVISNTDKKYILVIWRLSLISPLNYNH